MVQAIYFDMDGTIADLYGYDGWLDCLIGEDVRPYIDCEPLFDAGMLESLQALRAHGVRIGVISWGCKGSSDAYLSRTAHAKAQWLQAHAFPCDELHVIAYGQDKAASAHVQRSCILVDDDEGVRASWADAQADRHAIEPSKCVDLVKALLLTLHSASM